MEIPGFTLRVNREAIFHYFFLAYIPGTLTAFGKVNELDGAHLIEIDLDNPSCPVPEEYYRIRLTPDYG